MPAAALHEALATEAGRLATFEAPQQCAKRRASSTKKKPPPGAVEWPHASLKPQEFAHAGFYYKPTSTHIDNVECFLCRKNLDNWEPGDNPIDEHLSHVPDCGWAINAHIEQMREDMTHEEEDPMSDKMVEARRATFRDAWPYEKKRGWKCQTQKMVDAGWCSNPIEGAEDCVYCFYCQISLDGWEPKDDPWEEHERRNPQCEFFALFRRFGHDQAPKKGTRGAKRGSKASRVSTQSAVSSISQEPSVLAIDDSLAGAEEDSVLSTMSTASKSGRGRKKTTKAKGAAKKTRKATASEVQVPDPIDLEEPSPAPEAHDEEVSAADTETKAEPEAPAKRQPKPRRGTRQKRDMSVLEPSNAETKPADVEDPAEAESAEPAKPVTKGKRQTRKRAATVTEDEGPAAPAQAKPARAPRGKKRTSDGHEKIEADAVEEPAAPATKRGRPSRATTSRQTTEVAQAIPDEDMPDPATVLEAEEVNADQDENQTSLEDLSEPEMAAAPEPAKASKKKKDAPKPLEREPTAQQATAKQGRKGGSKASKASKATKEVEEKPAAASKKRSKKSPSPLPEPLIYEDETAEPLLDEDELASDHVDAMPATTVPAQADTGREGDVESSASPARSASAQSSDAENQPPSARAAHQAAPLSPRVTRVPLNASTPRTSPTRQPAEAARLQSSFPWHAIDMAIISAPGSGASKENMSLETVLESLTSPEKRMTVEEWIHSNADHAGDQLRDECERMIGKFESEGVRALRSLEGIECL